MAGTEGQFYEEKDAEEILRLAAAGDPHLSGAMTRERLIATAAEIGISEEAVIRAERQHAEEKAAAERKKQENLQYAREITKTQLAAMSGVGQWLGLVILLGGINLLTSHAITWSRWPIGVVGICLLVEFVEKAFRPNSTRQARLEARLERKAERRQWRDRR